MNEAPNNRPISWFGLIMAVVIILALLGTGAMIVGKELGIGPLAPVLVEVVDYGRADSPIPELQIDEPSGYVIVHVTEAGAASIPQAIESLDDVVALVVNPSKDRWVYYYDTVESGEVWRSMRCEVADLDLPIADRHCQSNRFYKLTPVENFYDLGFRSMLDS